MQRREDFETCGTRRCDRTAGTLCPAPGQGACAHRPALSACRHSGGGSRRLLDPSNPEVGFESHVVDAASIATSRRRRRAKTDKIDVEGLVRALLAYKQGEPRVARGSGYRASRRRTAVVSAMNARFCLVIGPAMSTATPSVRPSSTQKGCSHASIIAGRSPPMPGSRPHPGRADRSSNRHPSTANDDDRVGLVVAAQSTGFSAYPLVPRTRDVQSGEPQRQPSSPLQGSCSWRFGSM